MDADTRAAMAYDSATHSTSTLLGRAQVAEAMIPAAVTEVSERVAELHRELDVIQDRLSAVLSAPRPSEVQKGMSPPETSPLAEQLHSLTQDVASARDRVHDLILRLDL